MTDGSGTTIVDADKFAISDGGTEKYVLASDIQTYIEGSALNITGSLQVSGQSVATQPFAIAQAIALG